MEPLVGNSYGNHIPDPAIDNDVSFTFHLTVRHIYNNMLFYRSAWYQINRASGKVPEASATQQP
jgi:hypothetical protein